jgi:hypothetical protein
MFSDAGIKCRHQSNDQYWPQTAAFGACNSMSVTVVGCQLFLLKVMGYQTNHTDLLGIALNVYHWLQLVYSTF